ncbi:MAG: Hpt domain-containing protein [Deltaproteobacteria bacterium]|nr:Hpt domain-containing protein [Deltaproteobacteria bacterium]
MDAKEPNLDPEAPTSADAAGGTARAVLLSLDRALEDNRDGPDTASLRSSTALATLAGCFRVLGARHEASGHHVLAALGEQGEFTSQRLRASSAIITHAMCEVLLDSVEALGEPSEDVDEQTAEPRILELLRALNDLIRARPITSDLLSDQELFASEAALLLDEFRNAIDVVSQKPDEAPEAIGAAFRAMHTLKGNAGMIGDVVLERMAKDAEDALDGLRGREVAPTRTLLGALRGLGTEMLLRVQDPEHAVDETRVMGRLHAELKEAREVAERTLLGGLLVSQGVVTSEEISLALAIKQEPLGEGLVRLAALDPGQLEAILALQRRLQVGGEAKTTTDKPRTGTPSPLVTVEAARLKVLHQAVESLLGCVVRRCAPLTGLADGGGWGEIDACISATHQAFHRVDHISIGPTLRRMSRLANEVARSLNKCVQATLIGADIEVHRDAISAISDPLLHLVRNAVDHGIEQADERVREGKCAFGSLTITARVVGGRLVLDIRDDGRGIDTEAIIARAQSRGLISPTEAAQKSSALAYRMIFSPGFTSKTTVSNLSGRGVGLDVVKTSIEAVGGSVHVESKLREGTCFVLEVPAGVSSSTIH